MGSLWVVEEGAGLEDCAGWEEVVVRGWVGSKACGWLR